MLVGDKMEPLKEKAPVEAVVVEAEAVQAIVEDAEGRGVLALRLIQLHLIVYQLHQEHPHQLR